MRSCMRRGRRLLRGVGSRAACGRRRAAMTAVLKPVGESDPFLLTNLSPRSTGLPVVVWVHERGHVEVEGDLSAADRQAVLGWI